MKRKATTLPYTELEVADGNFDTSRSPIDQIIIHTMVGTWQGAAARFDNPTSKVSAHYGIKLDGGIIHWLEEYYTAYHAGNYATNQRSIGIEHEDGNDYNGVRPDVLYASSAKLVADICKFYNIPIDRNHIKKHSEVSDNPTGCPDALNIERIVAEAQALAGSVTNTTKAVEFDRVVSFLYAIGLLPTDRSEDYPNDKLLEAVKALKADRDNQARRAGWYDKVCLALNLTGDTSQIDYTQVLNKVEEQSSEQLAKDLAIANDKISKAKADLA